MSTEVRCHCQSCTIRSLTGPAIVITIGILFLLHQLHVQGGHFYFGNTWPVILVVIGFLHLASSLALRDGHIASTATTPQTPPPAPPGNAPQSPYGNQGQ